MKWERVQFPSVSEVVTVHDDIIEISGGAPGILQPDRLEASVMAPQATYAGRPLLGTLAEIAAAYAVYISTGHPFRDGNKRTAIAVALAFLGVNGYEIQLGDDETWEDAMGRVVDGDMTQDDLAEVFASLMGERGEIE
jgi:death on curing protein